jgi:hypothetical protein
MRPSRRLTSGVEPSMTIHIVTGTTVLVVPRSSLLESNVTRTLPAAHGFVGPLPLATTM